MDIALALAAALLFALGTVLQQRAGLEAPVEGSSSGLLVQMAKRPVWLLGILADGFGFIAQAAALGFGRLAGVEALLGARGVFCLAARAAPAGQKGKPDDYRPRPPRPRALVAFL